MATRGGEALARLLRHWDAAAQSDPGTIEGECPICHAPRKLVTVSESDDGRLDVHSECSCDPSALIATLRQISANGSRPRETAAPTGKDEPEPRLFRKFLTFHQLLNQPPPVWMLEGIFFEQSLIEFYGASNHGKTFVVSDIALSIRRGGMWCGRQIHKPGAVVYVNADGGLGFADRARAWNALHASDDTAKHEFYTYPEPVSLHQPLQMHEFLAAMAWLPEKPVFVVFDTYSQCIPGMNENQQEQASLVIQVLNKIKNDFGATPTLLHHTNASGDRERGSNVIIGACDTQILIQKPDEGRLRMSCTKQRDSRYFDPIHFDLVRVPGTNFVWPQVNSARGDNPHEVKQGSLARLEAVLAEYPGSSPKWLMQQTGITRTTLYRHIDELKQAVPKRIYIGPVLNYEDDDWTTRKPDGYYNEPVELK